MNMQNIRNWSTEPLNARKSFLLPSVLVVHLSWISGYLYKKKIERYGRITHLRKTNWIRK